MLRTFLLTMFALSGAAHAGVTAEKFAWENSGRFFLNLTIDGRPTEIRGNVRIGETTLVQTGQIAAEVKSYAGGKEGDAAISVILTVDGNDVAQVVLIQADRGLEILTPTAIPDRKATVKQDLEAVMTYLKQRKGWGALQSFQWIRDWDKVAPGKSLFAFVDRVEVDEIQVPKPTQTSDDERRRQQNWETSRRAEAERQIRRGQSPGPGPYSNRQPPNYAGGPGYPPPPPTYADPSYRREAPPPPSRQGRNYPGQRYPNQGQPYPDSGYGGYPPPPPGQGFIGQIFGNN